MIGNVGLLAHGRPVLLIAGRGQLPRMMIEALGPRACVVALEGFADRATCELASQTIPLGHMGAMVSAGQAADAQGVLFIGGLDRPTADQLRLDDYTLENLNLRALKDGDDAVLRAVADLFAKAGFPLVGPLDLVPDLAMPVGSLGTVQPAQEFQGDADRGAEVTQALGRLDVGQAGVVQQGLVLALEGIEGTDALIQRAGALARPGRAPVLIKMAKPQQDLRLDTPTFGPETIASLAQAGFAGAYLQAGKTLIVDRPQVVAAADAAGLFVTALPA